MSQVNIALLFLGWLAYWLSMGRLAYKAKGTHTAKDVAQTFAEDNVFDFALSLVNCLAIIISKNQMSFELVDTSQPGTVLLAGFASTVIINHIIKQFFNGNGNN